VSLEHVSCGARAALSAYDSHVVFGGTVSELRASIIALNSRLGNVDGDSDHIRFLHVLDREGFNVAQRDPSIPRTYTFKL
jgi:hypothetical protein